MINIEDIYEQKVNLLYFLAVILFKMYVILHHISFPNVTVKVGFPQMDKERQQPAGSTVLTPSQCVNTENAS